MKPTNEIVPISIGSQVIDGSPVPTVNLRDLHKALESKQQFADWAKARLTESMAVEGQDYLLHKFMKQVPHQGGRRKLDQTDFYATIDTAKHIAMLERNEKGRKVRAYFIEAEKRLQSVSSRGVTPVEFAQAYLAAALQAQAADRLLELVAPVNNYGAIASNGQPKMGMRRAAYVAHKQKLDEAAQCIDRLKELNNLRMQQLELGLLV